MEKQLKFFDVFVFDYDKNKYVRWGSVRAFSKHDAEKSMAHKIVDEFGHFNYYIGEEICL